MLQTPAPAIKPGVTPATAPKGTDETVKTMEKLRQELKIAHHQIDELKRTKRGTTRANAHVANIESQLERYASRLTEIEATMASDPAIAKAYEPEIATIKARIEELFAKAIGENATLRNELTQLAGTVDGHTAQLEMLEEGQQSLSQRVDTVHTRITVLENIRKVALWPLVVGLIVGVIAWFLWLNNFSYTQLITYADGTTAPITYEPARTVGAWFVGIAAGAITAYILTLVAARRASRVKETEVVETEVQYDNKNVTDTLPVRDSEPKTAPTRVSTTQGANSGAH